MNAEWVRQLKLAKQELDDRTARKALSTITALLSSLTAAHPTSDKEKKKHTELHYQALLLAGLINQRLYRLPSALAAYTQAAQLQPDNPAAYKALHELHSLTRDDDAIITLSSTLIPIMQQAPDAKRVPYLVQLSQLLLDRGRTLEAKSLLYPLMGLDPKDDAVVEDGPVVDSRVFLPPAFYRLSFGLFLQLDDVEKARELSTRVDRQLRKLRDRREEEKIVKEKAEAKRQQQQKAREGRVTALQVSREERERIARLERDEEDDVRRKVAAKLNSDWLRRDDNEPRLQRLHDWAEGYGGCCDDACAHREEEAWVKRRIERMNIAATAEEYGALRTAVLSTCGEMRKTHLGSGWCREQLAGMQADLWDNARDEHRVELLRSLRYVPASSTLLHALALLLCGGADEDPPQAERDRVVQLIMQQHRPATVFPPSLSSLHFWSMYLSAYSLFRSASTAAHLTACLQSIQSTLGELIAYQSEHPFHPLTGCLVALHLLQADVLVCARDEKSTEEAAQLYEQYSEDKEQRVRRYAVYGLVKAAVLRRSMDPTAALAQVKRWKQDGGANPNTVAWLSAYIYFTRYEDELLLRRETVRHLTREQRAERKAADKVLLLSLLKALSNARPSFPVLLLKGKVMWALGGEYRTDKQRAYEAFVAALSEHASSSTQSSPFALSSALLSQADCFAYVGLYTLHALQLPLKAQLFFWKALHIQPHNFTAGPALARLLSQAEQDSQLLSVFTSAILSDSRCRWAYLLSARYHVQRDMAQQGIAQFQLALRCGDKSGGVWSELGGGYFAVGSFVAALRCWKRAAEINPEDDAAKYGTAQVLLMLNMHHDAIDLLHAMVREYQALPTLPQPDPSDPVDEEDSPPRFAPVLAVTRLLADAFYALAVHQCNTGAYRASIASISSCIDTALSCLPLTFTSSSPDQRGGTYKVLGDAHFLYAQLPVDGPAELTQRAAAAELPSKEKVRLLLLADRYFAKAIHLHPTLASLWYDCGLVNRQLTLVLHSTTVDAGDECQERAVTCMKQAVTLSPQNSFHWLGLASAMPSFAARHYALVQSIRNEKNPTSWAHLSLFYLQHGGGTLSTAVPHALSGEKAVELTSIGDASAYSHLDAARLSLQLAQTMDPMHPAVWLAQGLFNSGFEEAEVLASAASCFGRSVELGATYEARVGLAWCSIAVQDWLTAAYEARKLVEQWPERSTAWVVHGACSEWQGRHAEAERAYQISEQLMATERLSARTSPSAQATAEEERARRLLIRIARVNRARVFCSLGRYADSILLTQSIMQEDVELAIPSASCTSLYLYHLLVTVYSKGGQYEEGRRVVVAAMELITQARDEVGETEESAARVRQLAVEYHLFLVEFVDLLMYEGKDDEALQHLHDKLEQPQQQEEEDDSVGTADEEEQRLQLLGLQLRIAMQQRNSALLQSTVTAMQQSTQQLLRVSPPSSHASALRTLHEAAVSAAIAQGDIGGAQRALVKALMLDPTSVAQWNDFLAFRMDHFPSQTTSILPTITIPHLHELRFKDTAAIVARLRLLARAYLLTNRFSPTTASLSYVFEEEERSNRGAEEQQLMSHAVADTSADDGADDDATAIAADVTDDEVRHDAPVDPALARLATVTSTSFTFDEATAPPSSRQAVSAAARLVLLDPTAHYHWELLAAAAEGRERDRWRYGLDSDAGWNSVVGSSSQHSSLLQQQTFTHLSPLDASAAQQEAFLSSVRATLTSVYALSHVASEVGREQRLTSMQQSLSSIPAEGLTPASLRHRFHWCKARVQLYREDVHGALAEYQQCIAVASAAVAVNGSASSSSMASADSAAPPSQAVIWEEIALDMGSEEDAVHALQSGLQLLDQQGAQDSASPLTSDRLALVLALLDCYHRGARWQAGLAFLQSEAAFLTSVAWESPLLLSVLWCDWMEWADAPRGDWRREARLLATYCQEWENDVSGQPRLRWEQPLPARTRWHLAQLEAEQKRWAEAARHLSLEQRTNADIAVEEPFQRLLADVAQRMREAPVPAPTFA